MIPFDRLLSVPAHIHHAAYLMKDPPSESRAARDAFARTLSNLGVGPDRSAINDRFGYGVLEHAAGDRLVIRWQLHTEYYTYQLWYLPADPARRLAFGPLEWPGAPPVCSAFGETVTTVDLIVTDRATEVAPDFGLSADHTWFGGRVLGEPVLLFTDFAPDAHGRRRYLLHGHDRKVLAQVTPFAADCVAKIENYYHLILAPLPGFSAAMDQVFRLEKRQLADRDAITRGLAAADPAQLQAWLTQLTEALADVSRLGEAIRYNLASAGPYDSILRTTVEDLREQPLERLESLGAHVLRRIRGIADGYQRLIQRIEALEQSFEGMVSIIRTRIDLAMEQQNLTILSSVDRTTKIQVRLQHMVESLSIVVQAYYLTGLGSYVFKAMEHYGWLGDATTATALFIPAAFALAFFLTWQAKRLLTRHTEGSGS
ncbi:MAG TPA: DUF3422 family protein [Nitrospiria bacterium]|nr:DUF3422 family protein [Nitrospiria bacterium]